MIKNKKNETIENTIKTPPKYHSVIMTKHKRILTSVGPIGHVVAHLLGVGDLAQALERVVEFAGNDPDLVRVATGELGQHLHVLVGQQRLVRLGRVDGVEHLGDRLRLALGAQHLGLPVRLRPQHCGLAVALGAEDGGLAVTAGRQDLRLALTLGDDPDRPRRAQPPPRPRPKPARPR